MGWPEDGWAEGLLSSSLILTWRPEEVVGHAIQYAGL